jgi:hypothetical protein
MWSVPEGVGANMKLFDSDPDPACIRIRIRD